NADAVVTKLSPAGNALVYSTYLGGYADERALGIAVDAAGSAYVTGWTTSMAPPGGAPAFPTQNPYPSSPGRVPDAFATKLAPDGKSLVFSTFLGGASLDQGNAIAVDALGRAYVTGWTKSSNFATSSGAYQTSLRGSEDVFVTRLSASGSALSYSTYLGG